ncbi:MAG TPA: nitroreductase [Burkholderiales bacterium]
MGAGLKALLEARYSCRGFLDKPVPRETIESILTAAQRTPSWCNSQPWQVILTSGAATEALRAGLLADIAASPAPQPDFPTPREYLGVYLERRRACGFQLYEAVGVKRGDKEGGTRQAMENFRLFGAPHALVVTTPEPLGVYGVLDCGAWVNNFMLAAQDHGVATIAQAALAGRSPFLRRHFGIAEDRRVVCGISFGYEDPAHPANRFRTAREAISAVVDWRDA